MTGGALTTKAPLHSRISIMPSNRMRWETAACCSPGVVIPGMVCVSSDAHRNIIGRYSSWSLTNAGRSRSFPGHSSGCSGLRFNIINLLMRNKYPNIETALSVYYLKIESPENQSVMNFTDIYQNNFLVFGYKFLISMWLILSLIIIAGS